LAVDEHVAHGKVLRQARQGIVNRHVAVRVVFTQNFSHNLGGLCGFDIVAQAHVAHGIEYAAVYRFEPVADIGQGAGHNHAHGIIQIRLLHLFFDWTSVYGADIKFVLNVVCHSG
jgi:hypothetical protein